MNRLVLLVLVVLAAVLALSGCTEKTEDIVLPPDDGDGGTEQAKTTCLGCHSSEEMLKAALGGTSGSKVLIGDKGDG